MPANTIVWTEIDEAPALATYSLFPVVQAFLRGTGIEIEKRNISLAGRILANFGDFLTEDQRIPDYLQQLGELAKLPAANIVKLPNISASIPQLQDAIKELQSKGFAVPDYPEEPKNEEEKKLKQRFSKVLGSAVNPVLREGNSDRRAAASVKRFAQKNPHRMMKPWPESGSKTRVAHMQGKDFFDTEKSMTVSQPLTAAIKFAGEDGKPPVSLKEGIKLQAGETIDTAVMNVAALRSFFAEQIANAKQDGVLLSLHLKATMMKVSDPIMFGHCVEVYYEEVLNRHKDALANVGANANNGLADILDKVNRLPEKERAEILEGINAINAAGPGLAMVDSSKGITNLHVPNNVIIDASMPNVIRDGGRMWSRDDTLVDTIAMVPDRSYARMYQAVVEDCQKHGQFDPATMGSVANIGLMAQKAEEYGSHDKTFEAPGNGRILVVDDAGTVLHEHEVATGDIFRMCQTKDAAVRDWVKLAVTRARASQTPAVFWLDTSREHDSAIQAKVGELLKEHDLTGLEIHMMPTVDAMNFTLERIRRGADTIAVTGNVLRDYLTDLFPILELGTSARMLSIVPLMNGGGLFETGAGGSAPKHVEQFIKEGHLRWDSLGEYCALVPSLEHTQSAKGKVLATALDTAIERYLEEGKSPSRKVNELDNRGSTYYLTMYWAQAMADQKEDGDLAARFTSLAAALKQNETTINEEFQAAQGDQVDIGGYYFPDAEKAEQAMRPSSTLNNLIDQF